jgi:phospholipid N-methyltransferase
VCHDVAQNLSQIIKKQGWEHADLIISGIPFTTLPKYIAKEIIQSIYDNIKPGGMFVAYQFRDRVGKLATPIFGESVSYWEFKNLPPMKIYIWKKEQ